MKQTQPSLFPEFGTRSGRCRVCNRKLTDPESIELGVGPVCGRRKKGGKAVKWVATKEELCLAIDGIWEKFPKPADPLEMQALAEQIGEIKNLIEHLPTQEAQ